MHKMSGYVKTFKVKDGNKDKSNKLMSFGIDDEKLSEKFKAIWFKIEDLKNIDIIFLPVYDDIKTKLITYGNRVYTNFRWLIVPEDNIECAYFTVISIDLYIYKIVNKQMTDYLDENIFED